MSGRGHYLLAFATVALVGLAVETLLGPAVPLRTSIDEFPLRIGSWTGSPEPIDTSFLQRARPDQVLNRRYLDEMDRAILLYVGYYERQASRAQALAVCSGECQVLGTEPESIAIHGDTLAVRRARVYQSGTPMTVVYWYQEGSWVIQDGTRDRLARVWRALVDRRSNGALVRVSTRIVTTEAEARGRSVAFVRALVPSLRSYLPH